MTVLDELSENTCTFCLENSVKNANHIDTRWRDKRNRGYWPKPFKDPGTGPEEVKGIVVGQDPTIDDPHEMEYVLEANKDQSRLGGFLRDVFGMLPNTPFNELYFTNLVKCRFDEKPGKDNRNIGSFLDDLAFNCYRRYLQRELKAFENATYIFSLGRDNFGILAKLLDVPHRPLREFKDFHSRGLPISSSVLDRECYLVPLPHQPTYDLATRYSPYAKDEVRKRLRALHGV